MGLADFVLDHLAFTGHSNEAQLAENVLDLMHPSSSVGGLSGVLGALDSKGMGKEAQSWVAKGQNGEVSAEQIKALFADPRVAAAMQHSLVSPDQAASMLTKWLPFAINFVTPNGKVPPAAELGRLISGLKQ